MQAWKGLAGRRPGPSRTNMYRRSCARVSPRRACRPSPDCVTCSWYRCQKKLNKNICLCEQRQVWWCCLTQLHLQLRRFVHRQKSAFGADPERLACAQKCVHVGIGKCRCPQALKALLGTENNPAAVIIKAQPPRMRVGG